MRNYFCLTFVPAFGFTTVLFPYLAVIVLLTAAAIIDIKERRIPDKLVFAGAAIGLIFSLFDSNRGFLDSLIGGVTAGLVLLLIHYITKGGLGLGDVKLFGCAGIYLGLESTVSAMLLAAATSGLFSLVLICINRDNKKRELPFAPFILMGVLTAVIL